MMKRVIIDIDDKYADILSISAVGLDSDSINVSTYAVDLKSCERIVIDNIGACTIIEKEEGNKSLKENSCAETDCYFNEDHECVHYKSVFLGEGYSEPDASAGKSCPQYIPDWEVKI